MNFKNITTLQWIGIIILFNTTLLGSASQLGDLSLTPNMVKAILAFATLGNGFLGGLVTMFGGQGSMVATVSNFTGVEPLKINANASPALAAVAMDPAQDKVSPKASDIEAVNATAKGE